VSEAEKDAAVDRADTPAGARAFWEQAGTLGLALLIAVGIRAFVFEPFRIPSGSMFPTLLIGDHLFVNKFVYGVKIPFGEARLPGIRAPERGDIAVFTVARDGSETIPADRRPELPREQFVKRIIGLPGDRIAFRDGEIFVNGERVEAMHTGEVFEDDYGRHLEIREVALGERRFQILDDPGIRLSPEGERVVEEGRYFMLGDNRDHSKDSREWGTVRLAEIKGPAFVLYWSWDFNGRWIELLNPATWWRAELRWERFGASLD
jgi:signal peptidase I